MHNDDPHKSALSVSDGVNQPPSINPNLKKIARKKLTTKEYLDGILSGNRTILSKAITLIESSLSEHVQQAQEIIERCLVHSGKSVRIGITGVPGVGKSTFIEALGNFLIQQGHRLCVLAIDPSSERSGGSILGDKTRMETLSSSENAFIRPSPSAGSLGGVARKTRETILLCEAAGFDIIFVETVGVGQSEVVVHSMVDFFLLLMLAGAGDELQGIKRGIMEMADMITITKADGNNIEKATRAAAEYRSALHLFPPAGSGWTPPVLTSSSLKNSGIAEVWGKIEEYLEHTRQNDYFMQKRQLQSRYWMIETINEQLKSHFYTDKKVQEQLQQLESDVVKNKISSFVAAQKILDFYFKRRH